MIDNTTLQGVWDRGWVQEARTINYYVSTTGSIINNGLTPTSPKALPQQVLDSLPPFSNATITINVSAGTYLTGGLIARPMIGTDVFTSSTTTKYSNMIQIVGDTTTPGNVVFDAVGNVGLYANNGGTVYLRGVTMKGDTTQAAFYADGSNIILDNVDYLNVTRIGTAVDGGTISVEDTTNCGAWSFTSGVFSTATMGAAFVKDDITFELNSASAITAFSASSFGRIFFSTGKTYTATSAGAGDKKMFNEIDGSSIQIVGTWSVIGFADGLFDSSGSSYARFSMVGASTVLTSGTASGGAASDLIDVGSGWVVNAYAGKVLYISSGTGSIETRYIVSNTADTLTVQIPFDATPDATTVYAVYEPNLTLLLTDCGVPFKIANNFDMSEGNQLIAVSYLGTTPQEIWTTPATTIAVSSMFCGAKLKRNPTFFGRNYRFGDDLFRTIPIRLKHTGILPASLSTYMTADQNESNPVRVHTANYFEEVWAMYVNISTAGTTIDTFRVYKNGIATACTVSITAATSGSIELDTPVRLIAGDYLTLQCTSAANPATDVTVELVLRNTYSAT